MRIRALLLLLGVVLGIVTPVSLATFREQAVSTGNTVTADPDWIAPAVAAAAVQKSQGGKAGYVKPGGSYYLCTKIGPDSGNPASGLKSVTADLTRLTDSLLNQVLGTLLSGPCTSPTYDRSSGPHTVKADATSGAVSVTTRDNDDNTRTGTASVTVDGRPPSAVSFSATNGGATVNRVETNDVLVFTYDEPIDPESLVAGWSGAAAYTGLTVRFTNAGGSDMLDVWRGTPLLSPQVPVTLTSGTSNYLSLNNQYVKNEVRFTGSSMTIVGNTVRVTLGTPNVPTNVVTSSGTNPTTWRTSPNLFDWAGNTRATQTITEGAAEGDAEF